MTSQPTPFIPTVVGETRAQAVARRLRGQLAERNISVSELARRLNVPQAKMQRRTGGGTPFPINEIDDIARVTGIDANYILTGFKAETPPTRGGNYSGLHTESNRGPSHYMRNGSLITQLFPTRPEGELALVG